MSNPKYDHTHAETNKEGHEANGEKKAKVFMFSLTLIQVIALIHFDYHNNCEDPKDDQTWDEVSAHFDSPLNFLEVVPICRHVQLAEWVVAFSQ